MSSAGLSKPKIVQPQDCSSRGVSTCGSFSSPFCSLAPSWQSEEPKLRMAAVRAVTARCPAPALSISGEASATSVQPEAGPCRRAPMARAGSTVPASRVDVGFAFRRLAKSIDATLRMESCASLEGAGGTRLAVISSCQFRRYAGIGRLWVGAETGPEIEPGDVLFCPDCSVAAALLRGGSPKTAIFLGKKANFLLLRPQKL